MQADGFRFSPHADRATDINWHGWGRDAFAHAGDDRLIFLNISAFWSQQCRHMDETTFCDDAIIELLNENFVPIRVDADRMPHVQDRYIAGGWPTNAILAPTGEVFWQSTYVEPRQLQEAALAILGAWRSRRDELTAELDRRRRALQTAQVRHTPAGLVRREVADDLRTALQESFDARNGGFGEAPKFPDPEAIELLYVLGARGDSDALRMADLSLDGMLAGEILDRDEGGFFRYTLNEDWTGPRREKLLAANATMLRCYARASAVRERKDWADVARALVAWADERMRRDDGLWHSSQADDEAYWSLAPSERSARAAPVDATLYTAPNAAWIAALADAGAVLGEAAWVSDAERALEQLLDTMTADVGTLYHYRAAAEPRIDFLLGDSLHAAIACLSVASALGDGAVWRTRARELARTLEQCFWADDGGFYERRRTPDDVPALSVRERPFDANADAARFLLRLARACDERGLRARGERILAVFSPTAARYGVAGARLALAVEEYFDSGRRR